MTPSREQKIREVVNRRQPDLTVILENVHDHHNIGAVVRTCDSVGIKEVYLLLTQPVRFSRISLGKKTTAGTRRWVDLYQYTDRQACFEKVRQNCTTIYATHLGRETAALHDLDLTQPVALVFGNEKYGISAETLALCDGNFRIPQMGMAMSLNISVACAISLYEAYRQRSLKGMYDHHPNWSETAREALFQDYYERAKNKIPLRKILPDQ